ncbi:MAG: GGDEF domain-containing protein [Lachnospiraceae bacterium]|nr:GGDEF domain-containing protein [Lachnospiraceae bacterium]
MKRFPKIREYLINNITSNRFKFSLILYAVTFVHSFYIVLFALLGVVPLVIFNIFSVALYIACIHIIKYGYEKNSINVFYATYIEIVLHSLAAAICIGWSFGFSQYLIGIIPFCYYICVTMMENKQRYSIATVLGFIAYISFIFCRMITLIIGHIYVLDISPTTEFLIYTFNATSNFIFLFMVTFIFIVDMQITNNRLHIQNAKLDTMASIDPLTGLYNRRSMQVFLDDALASDETFSMVMCDIDNFKKVNDTYGHDFGDVVLKDIAAIIKQLIGVNGNVCRWGGEEILILSNDSMDNTCQIAENIRKTVENHVFSLRDTSIHCTLTLGVATHKKGAPIDETITHADGRLYYGKQNGKNRVVTPYDTA